MAQPTTQTPAAEAPSSQPATQRAGAERPLPTASDPTGAVAQPTSHRALSLEEILSRADLAAPPVPDVSNEGGTAEPTPVTDGEPPADEAGSKPSDADEPPGDGEDEEADAGKSEGGSRRARAREANLKRIADLESEVSRLKSETADPEADRQASIDAAVQEARRAWEDEQQRRAADSLSEADRKAALEREERYRTLRDRPTSSLSADEYEFVEAERERREKYPELQRHYETVLEAERTGLTQAAEQELARQQAAFWDSVKADLATAKTLPGVDLDAVKAAETFAARDALLHAAGAAWKEAEVRAELEPKVDDLQAKLDDLQAKYDEADAEISELKLVGPRGLGARRAPLAGGRSADDASFNLRPTGRESLHAALGAS